VASSNVVNIDLISIAIQAKPGQEPGYQWGIADGCDFRNNNILVCDGSQNNAPVTNIQGSNFIPGQTYYLYVDGWQSSDYVFRFNVISGIGDLVVDTVNNFIVDGLLYHVNDTVSICHNGRYTIESAGINNAASLVWMVGDELQDTDTTLTYRFSVKDSVYQVSVAGYTDCGTSPFGSLYFRVDTIADMIFNDTIVCAADLSAGIIPSGWLGDPIASPGQKHYRVLLQNGCYYWQRINVIRAWEDISTVDTVLCNVNSFTIDGETFTEDNVRQVTYQNSIGCDSIVNYRIYFMKFNASISSLKCFPGNNLGLSIEALDFDPTEYSDISVIWYRDNVAIQNTDDFDIYPISQSGNYSAIVTLYKNGISCSFLLDEVNISAFPDPSFTISQAEICVTDTLNVAINNYLTVVDYELYSQNLAYYQNQSGGNFKLRWQFPGDYTIRVVANYLGCTSERTLPVSVKKALNLPVLNCTNSTNSSVEFDWFYSDSDCIDGYEIEINGNPAGIVSSGPFVINDLSQGEAVNITVTARSNCECPQKSYTAVCVALPCPDRVVEITGLPDDICFDQLNDTYTLDYSSSDPAIAQWSGDGVSTDGVLSKSGLKTGINTIFLALTIDECPYYASAELEVFPEVKFDLEYEDISCYDSEDGVLTVFPLQGTPDYNMILNGMSYAGLSAADLPGGDYIVELHDSKGCRAVGSFRLIMPVMPIIEIEGEKQLVFNESHVYRLYTNSDPQQTRLISWFLNDELICENRFCDSVRITAAEDFTLCVEMIYGDDCFVDDCISVRVTFDSDIFIPNIFTQDFDGVNDRFTLRSKIGRDVNIRTMQIFDRWGEKVYQIDDAVIGRNENAIGWDGTFRGRRSPTGVYVYYIELIEENGELSKYAGDVTLIR
jgi:gliding motility-associated-like protein